MKKIGIIGAGFCGTMTAVHLIENSKKPIEIILINSKKNFNKGVAFDAFSEKHLLNVPTGKMSAFPDHPQHFLNWILEQEGFENMDSSMIEHSFLPRKTYGNYLTDIWEKAKKNALQNNICLFVIESQVDDIDVKEKQISLDIKNIGQINVDACVLANGNNVPGNLKIKNMEFYTSPNYFQNPWRPEAFEQLQNDSKVLILGSGLSMVDTVLSVSDQVNRGKIISVSPNGFNILPHRHNEIKYTKLTKQLKENMSLYDLIKLIRLHTKSAQKLGVSAAPIIDSLRPYTQKLWISFSTKEQFHNRLRHLWNIARHKIPIHTHDYIHKLINNGLLETKAGKIIDMREKQGAVQVEFFDKKENKIKTLLVDRVINCTGPEFDIMKMENSFLKKGLLKGLITQDALKMGITTQPETFQVIRSDGQPQNNLFTIGSNLRGNLLESTAVNELRWQSKRLAEILLEGH